MTIIGIKSVWRDNSDTKVSNSTAQNELAKQTLNRNLFKEGSLDKFDSFSFLNFLDSERSEERVLIL